MSESVTIPNELARELVDGETDEYVTVNDELQDTSRWSEIHFLVIKRKSDGKLFGSDYSCGLTEMQDEAPFEYAGDEVVFHEVEAYQETVTKYRVIK